MAISKFEARKELYRRGELTGELKEVFDGEKNLGTKPIFIFFKADWWGPCRMFKQVLDKVARLH